MRLAAGAEVAAPVSDREALEASTAEGAGSPPAMGDLKLKVGGAYLTAGAKVGIHTGSLLIDGRR